MLDFMRLGCAVPKVRVGDVGANTQDICAYMKKAEEAGCDLVLFPELALTGYTCGDLIFQEALQTATLAGLKKIAEVSSTYPALTVVVGLPLCVTGQIYNCGAVIGRGKLWGIIPKTYLPNYGEFSELRWWVSGYSIKDRMIRYAGQECCFGYAPMHSVCRRITISPWAETCCSPWVTARCWA